MFTYDELIKRDKASLDIFWLKDESLEDAANLPSPDVIAAEIVEDLRAERVSYHRFQRTFTTLVIARERNVKFVQKLLRHASSITTLENYAQAEMAAMRRTASLRFFEVRSKQMRLDRENPQQTDACPCEEKA